MRVKIVIAAYNCLTYLKQCLRSLEMQTFREFDVCVVDDASTDPDQYPYITSQPVIAVQNSENRGGLYSVVKGIEALACEDEDVICILDGDDWLATPHALQTVVDTYRTSDALLTYGSFETFPPGRANRAFLDQPVPQEVFEKGLFRDFPWVFVHMQTFKYQLWRQLSEDDLYDDHGDYFRVCGDRARFYPLLELARTRVRKIVEKIYIYNTLNPLSHFRIRPDEQQRALSVVMNKPRRHPL